MHYCLGRCQRATGVCVCVYSGNTCTVSCRCRLHTVQSFSAVVEHRGRFWTTGAFFFFFFFPTEIQTQAVSPTEEFHFSRGVIESFWKKIFCEGLHSGTFESSAVILFFFFRPPTQMTISDERRRSLQPLTASRHQSSSSCSVCPRLSTSISSNSNSLSVLFSLLTISTSLSNTETYFNWQWFGAAEGDNV